MNKLTNTKLALNAMLFTFSSLTQAVVTTINFDRDPSGSAINAPNLFSGATPLTKLYADLGVHFSAIGREINQNPQTENGVLVYQSIGSTLTPVGEGSKFSPVGVGMGAILNKKSKFFSSNAKSGENFLAFNSETTFGSNYWRISFDNPIGYFMIDRRFGGDLRWWRPYGGLNIGIMSVPFKT